MYFIDVNSGWFVDLYRIFPKYVNVYNKDELKYKMLVAFAILAINRAITLRKYVHKVGRKFTSEGGQWVLHYVPAESGSVSTLTPLQNAMISDAIGSIRYTVSRDGDAFQSPSTYVDDVAIDDHESPLYERNPFI